MVGCFAACPENTERKRRQGLKGTPGVTRALTKGELELWYYGTSQFGSVGVEAVATLFG